MNCPAKPNSRFFERHYPTRVEREGKKIIVTEDTAMIALSFHLFYLGLSLAAPLATLPLFFAV